MKLGLITDIHEHVVTLRRALAHLAELEAGKIVMIGDVVEMGRRLGRVSCLRTLLGAGLLTPPKRATEGLPELSRGRPAVGMRAGVGRPAPNADFGMCSEPDTNVFSHISPRVRAYMGTLQPRLVVEECHFSHVEPGSTQRSSKTSDFAGKPSEHGDFSRNFAATSHRLIFVGHYHAWQVVTPDRVLNWHGETPISLDSGRYLVTVGALCEGDYAPFDTESSLLTPLHLESGVV